MAHDYVSVATSGETPGTPLVESTSRTGAVARLMLSRVCYEPRFTPRKTLEIFENERDTICLKHEKISVVTSSQTCFCFGENDKSQFAGSWSKRCNEMLAGDRWLQVCQVVAAAAELPTHLPGLTAHCGLNCYMLLPVYPEM